MHQQPSPVTVTNKTKKHFPGESQQGVAADSVFASQNPAQASPLPSAGSAPCPKHRPSCPLLPHLTAGTARKAPQKPQEKEKYNRATILHQLE